MLCLSNVSKSLGTFQLEDISLELPKGYIMGLIGPNGSGKTTLLHLILGLYQPDRGDIRLEEYSYRDNEALIHEKLGVVLQEKLFFDTMTLLENARHYGKFYSHYDEPLLCRYLERFALRPEQYHNRLSKGEQLKFQFAFALSHHPDLLLLDEPTANFDHEFRDDFLHILKDYIADGQNSVILATHLTEDLDRIADYITYLNKGTAIAACDIETFKNRYRLLQGETYKIKLLPRESIIYMEENAYGTKALITHKKRYHYDSSLAVSVPTLEEIMYFVTKHK